jgi:hypothetical protein
MGKHVVLVLEEDPMTGNKEDKSVCWFDLPGKDVDLTYDRFLGSFVVGKGFMVMSLASLAAYFSVTP